MVSSCPWTAAPSNEDPARWRCEYRPGLASQLCSPVPRTSKNLLPIPVGTQPGRPETECLSSRDLLLTPSHILLGEECHLASYLPPAWLAGEGVWGRG